MTPQNSSRAGGLALPLPQKKYWDIWHVLAAPRSSGSSKWERAASGDTLVTKTVSDVPIEIDAFGCGGHQILKNGGWNAEVAVDRASTKLQLERFISGVNGRLEQGRIQRIETL
jgi:hypothetical protein